MWYRSWGIFCCYYGINTFFTFLFWLHAQTVPVDLASYRLIDCITGCLVIGTSKWLHISQKVYVYHCAVGAESCKERRRFQRSVGNNTQRDGEIRLSESSRLQVNCCQLLAVHSELSAAGKHHFCGKHRLSVQRRRSIWDRGDMSPQYLWRGGDHGNVPPIF